MHHGTHIAIFTNWQAVESGAAYPCCLYGGKTPKPASGATLDRSREIGRRIASTASVHTLCKNERIASTASVATTLKHYREGAYT